MYFISEEGEYVSSSKRWHLPTSLFDAKTRNIIILSAVKTDFTFYRKDGCNKKSEPLNDTRDLLGPLFVLMIV